MAHVAAHLPGPYRVVLYTRYEQGIGGDAGLVRVRAFARERGWTVADEMTDHCGGGVEPDARPGWRAVTAALCGGRAHGVLADHRDAVTPDDDVYRSVLRGLWARLVFLALPPGGDIKSWPPRHMAPATRSRDVGRRGLVSP